MSFATILGMFDCMVLLVFDALKSILKSLSSVVTATNRIPKKLLANKTSEPPPYEDSKFHSTFPGNDYRLLRFNLHSNTPITPNDLTLDMPYEWPFDMIIFDLNLTDFDQNDTSRKARPNSSTTINSIMCDVTQKADSNWRIRTERSFERRGSGDGSAVEHYPGERKLSIWFCKLKIKIMVLYHDFSTLLSRRWWWDILLYLSVNDSRSSIKVLIQC